MSVPDLASLPTRAPVRTLLIGAALVALAVASAMRARPNSTLEATIGRGQGTAAVLSRIVERFGGMNELLVLVIHPGGAHSAEDLRAFAERFRSAALADPQLGPLISGVAYRADPAAEVFVRERIVPAGAHYLDEAGVDRLFERLTPDSMREQIARNEAMIAAPGAAAGALAGVLLRDPLRLRELLADRMHASVPSVRTLGGGPEFISEDGTRLLVRVSCRVVPGDLEFSRAVTEGARAALERVNTGGYRCELSGAYAIASFSERAIRADMIRSLAASVLLMQGLFLIGYRNLLAFGLAFLPVGAGIAGGFGVFSLFSGELTPLAAVLGAVLAGLGIDYSIHFLSHFERSLADGATPQEAAAHTTRVIGPAMAAACGTSATGFGAVALSQVTALQDFALLGATGLILTLLSSLTLLPAAIVLLETRAPRLCRVRGARFGLGSVMRVHARRPLVSIIGAGVAALVAAGAAITGQGVSFETDLTVMHPRPNPPLETLRTISGTFGAVAETLIVHVTADSDQELEERLRAVAASLARPEVRGAGVAHTYGPASLLPEPSVRDRNARLADIEVEGVLRDFRAAIEASVFDPKAYAEHEEFLRAFLTNRSPPDLAAIRAFPSLAGTMLAPGSSEAVVLAFIDQPLDTAGSRARAVEGARTALAGLPGVTLTGLNVLGHDLELAVRRDLPGALGVAVVVVGLWLLAYFRRVTDVALACLPVAFGLLFLVGLMSVTGERINLANMVVMPMLIGVGMDYGIFAVSMRRRAEREGIGGEGLMMLLGAAGHAVIMTTLTNVLGFGSEIFTSMPAVESLGRIAAFGVAACALGAIFLLAPVLLATRRGGT